MAFHVQISYFQYPDYKDNWDRELQRGTQREDVDVEERASGPREGSGGSCGGGDTRGCQEEMPEK